LIPEGTKSGIRGLPVRKAGMGSALLLVVCLSCLFLAPMIYLKLLCIKLYIMFSVEAMYDSPKNEQKSAFPCDKCDAKCCRNYIICLTAADLAKLAKINRLDGVIAIPAEEIKSKSIPFFSILDAGTIKKFALCLRKDRKETCIFLKGNKCSIYPNRPKRCRIYPFELTTRVVVEKRARCPVQWQMTQNTAKDAADNILECEKELIQYRELCRLWEKQLKQSESGKKTFEEFIDFILKKLLEE
jgi:Fe-S-cluster containining protein